MESFNIDSSYKGGMPKQKVSYKLKNQQWKEECVDGVINLCNTYQHRRRSPFRIKRRNYDLFNNRINRADFDYVLNPFGLTGEQLSKFQMPASLQPYDELSSVFMLLFGEESSRMFSPIVRAINEAANNEKLQKINEMIFQAAQEYMSSQEMSEDQLEEKLNSISQKSYKDSREIRAQHLLTFLRKHEKADEVFYDGWKDALIASEEIYSIDEIAGAPRIRRVNPLEINFLLDNNTNYIDDAEMIYERNKLTVSQILDEFYDILTPAQIDDLEKQAQGLNTLYNYSSGNVPVKDFFPPFEGNILGTNIPLVNSIYDIQDQVPGAGIDIHRVRWKGRRKIGILHYIDENSQEQQMIVDEFFKEDKSDPDQYVEWMWINEYWQGIRIGRDMYLKIHARKHQFRKLDNLSECKSGYVGTIYSALNSQAVSLMDRLVPWYYLYLITWYRTELLLAANQGKIALIDLSLIPDGWEVEKWMYYASSMKIGFVNAYNEGLKGERKGQLNSSTQNKSLDIAQGNEIQFYISLLEFIERKIEDTSGVTRQRKGQIQSSELVGNTERAVIQSSHITEDYFRVHNGTKVRALECLVKVAQDILEETGGKSLSYVTDTMDFIVSHVDGKEISDVDLGIFITDSKKDNEVLEMFKNHMQAAIQNDKLDYSMIADVIASESISEIKNKLKEAERARMQQLQKIEQDKINSQEKIHDEKIQLEYEKLDREDNNKQLDRETQILEAEIKSLGTDTLTPDVDQSGMIIEQGNLALEHLKHQAEVQSRDKEIKQKEKELQMKKTVEDKKIKAIQTQNQSQEKMQQKELKFKEKELKVKERIEKFKARKAAKAKPKK